MDRRGRREEAVGSDGVGCQTAVRRQISRREIGKVRREGLNRGNHHHNVPGAVIQTALVTAVGC